MRGRKAVVNTIAGLLEEIISVICGFILPRLILLAFDSKYNGLTTSISQFLGCAVLLRSGIGGVTRAALYRPLAEQNNDKISSIVKATDIFMKKIALILTAVILGFATIYPIFVKDNFEWFFTFSLFLIIGASTFAESFFGITYKIVLQADQRVWILSVIGIICNIINTITAACLISCGATIHIVKLVSTVIYILYPIVLRYYVRKRYHINMHVKPDNKAIVQRWDAFWQQACVFVMQNTDVIVLTIFGKILEVSVYSIYRLVINGLNRGLVAFTAGLEGAFGNMIAKKEYDILRNNISMIETLLFSATTIIYTCAAVLILDFVKIYTIGINDVNYIRPIFAYTIILANFFNIVRLPCQLVVQAAGHYKQTRSGAIIEVVLNILISVTLVIRYGLIGVAVGTLVATVFRTIQYSIYMNKNVIEVEKYAILKKSLLSFVEMTLIILSINIFPIATPQNYIEWFRNAIVVFSVSFTIVMLFTVVFRRRDFNIFLKKINILKKSKS